MTIGDDAQVVVWHLKTGEKAQVLKCEFHGPVTSVIWTSSEDEDVSSFAFGCADGSVHFYYQEDHQVSSLLSSILQP
jgi:WD40 repeat protein